MRRGFIYLATSAMAGNNHSTGMVHNQNQVDQQRRIQAHDQMLRDNQEGLRRAAHERAVHDARDAFERFQQQERDRMERERLATIAEQKRIKQEADDIKNKAGVDLGNLYANFSSIHAHSPSETLNFVNQTASIVAQYPEYFPTAKQYFIEERRVAFKLVYAIVIFICDSDGDARTHLEGDGFSQAELDSLKINHQYSFAGVACVDFSMGSGGKNQTIPLSTIISNHIVF